MKISELITKLQTYLDTEPELLLTDVKNSAGMKTTYLYVGYIPY